MIRFDIQYGPNGTTIATCGGVTRSGQDPVRSIAREMVDDLQPDQPWEAGRPGRVDMRGRSLHWLAASNISETDNGFVRGWWTKHPLSESRPVLEAIVSRFRFEAALKRKASA